MPIRVKVLYFGQAREAAGSGAETLLLPARASVGTLIREATAAHKGMGILTGSMKVAVNEEIVDEGQELRDGDTVAFLPPVAGG
jgi:molybdopterin converting factor subunit 1